jgi:hypothetical protein
VDTRPKSLVQTLSTCRKAFPVRTPAETILIIQEELVKPEFPIYLGPEGPWSAS